MSACAEAKAAPGTAPAPEQCPSGRHGCRAMTAMVVEAINALVGESARDGVLSVDQFRRIIRHVIDDESVLVRAFHLQETRCRAAFRPKSDAAKRSDPFRRLITRPVEHLLEGDPPRFPRRFLPNYFQVVDQALGGRLDHIRTQTDAVFHGLRMKHGSGGVWDAFFADPRTDRILVHVLRRIVLFLDGAAGQWTWPLIMSRALPDGTMPSADQAEFLAAALRIAWKGAQAEEAAHGHLHH
ncbi:MAG: hypothetical protein M0006_10605 [Magnetospirillum sp.]|nr:hypothetical protein [Magnetospirillum sp.]